MIGNVGGYLAGVGFDKSKAGAGVAEVAGAKDGVIIPVKDNPAGADRGGSVSISTLAGQLAYSAGDSAEKNKGLGHAELAAKAARMSVRPPTLPWRPAKCQTRLIPRC